MKQQQTFRTSLITALLLSLISGAGSVYGGTLTVGDILVSDEISPGRIREFTPSGTLVQTFTFSGSDSPPRGITVDGNGNIQIYNGTFNPTLTTLNPVTGMVIQNTTFPGWSTVSNATYGGLAAYGNHVFATDMATGMGGAANGIVRFNVNDLSASRVVSGTDYIQITVGQNGLLYADIGNEFDVFDPATLTFQGRFGLSVDTRSLAVDAEGDIFAVNINDPNIYELNSDGVLMRTLTTDVDGFSEIQIDPSGDLVAAHGGTLVLTDTSLSSYSTLNVGTISGPDNTMFVAFVEPPLAPTPEPSSLALMILAAACGGGFAWRRRQRSSGGYAAPRSAEAPPVC